MSAGSHDTLVYRLAQMLVKLNQGERLDPQSLADEFGVNLRTIQRDLNERFAYLPLAKTNGHYYLDPAFPIKCLLLLNELDAAHDYAEAWRVWLRRNFRDLTPPGLVEGRLRSQSLLKGTDSDVLRLELLPQAEEFVAIVRVQQEFADSMPDLIRTLEAREIDGRDYIDRLRSEQREHVMLLEAAQD